MTRTRYGIKYSSLRWTWPLSENIHRKKNKHFIHKPPTQTQIYIRRNENSSRMHSSPPVVCIGSRQGSALLPHNIRLIGAFIEGDPASSSLSCCVCQVHPVPLTVWWWKRLQIAQHSSHGAKAETMAAPSLAMSSRPEHPSPWAGRLWTQVLYILPMKDIISFWHEGRTHVHWMSFNNSTIINKW